jgi:hypothetical protein
MVSTPLVTGLSRIEAAFAESDQRRFWVPCPHCGEFQVLEQGRYEYTVTAWVDAFKSWHHDLGRWVQAEDIALSLRVGAELAQKASQRASGEDAKWLAKRAGELAGPHDLEYRRQLGLDEEFSRIMARNADRRLALGLDLCALHVDYGLRGDDSTRDREIVERACAETGIELEVVCLEAGLHGPNFQARARDLRHGRARALAAARGCDVIATAHNRDDQAETILYRLAKYASPQAYRATLA